MLICQKSGRLWSLQWNPRLDGANYRRSATDRLLQYHQFASNGKTISKTLIYCVVKIQWLQFHYTEIVSTTNVLRLERLQYARVTDQRRWTTLYDQYLVRRSFRCDVEWHVSSCTIHKRWSALASVQGECEDEVVPGPGEDSSMTMTIILFIFACRFRFRNFSSQARDPYKINRLNCLDRVYHVSASQRLASSIRMVHLVWKSITLDLKMIHIITKNLPTKCTKCRNS